MDLKQALVVPPDEFIFHNPEPIARRDAVAILGGDNPEEIAETLVSVALNDPDAEWIEATCWRMAEHADPSVRGLAGLFLGHVARRFGALRAHSWEVVRGFCADPAVDNRPCDGLDDMRQYAGPEPPHL